MLSLELRMRKPFVGLRIQQLISPGMLPIGGQPVSVMLRPGRGHW